MRFVVGDPDIDAVTRLSQKLLQQMYLVKIFIKKLITFNYKIPL